MTEQTQEQNTISMGEWILSIFLCSIAIVGQILLLVWAFGSDTHPSKKNWARAMLIIQLVVFVLTIVFGTAFFTFLVARTS